jgi:hypothetical protein
MKNRANVAMVLKNTDGCGGGLCADQTRHSTNQDQGTDKDQDQRRILFPIHAGLPQLSVETIR